MLDAFQKDFQTLENVSPASNLVLYIHIYIYTYIHIYIYIYMFGMFGIYLRFQLILMGLVQI